jgi:glycerol-3-phosphate dehydrogenase
VVHLDDLLLRRVRVGLLLPEGGAAYAGRFRALCQQELGWDGARWRQEWASYRELWRCYYAPPDPACVPDWQPLTISRRAQPDAPSTLGFRGVVPASAGALILLVALFVFLWRRGDRRG